MSMPTSSRPRERARFVTFPAAELVELLGSESSAVRAGALMALSARLRGDGTVLAAVVERLAHDSSPQIRAQAAEKLAEVGDRSVVEQLKAHNRSETNAEVRRAVAMTVAKLELGGRPLRRS